MGGWSSLKYENKKCLLWNNCLLLTVLLGIANYFLIKLSMLMINPVFQNRSKNDALCFFGGSKEAVSTTQTIHNSGQKIIKT